MDATAVPALPPAKPYAGKPQHQSIRAAIRRFEDARLVSTKRYGTLPCVLIRTSGAYKNFHGVIADGVQVSFTPSGSRYRSPEPDDIARSHEVAEALIAALRAAGWTVEQPTVSDTGHRTFNVWGPGVAEWCKAESDRRRQMEARRQADQNERRRQEEEMNTILSDLGLSVRARTNRFGLVTVELNLTQLRQIVGGE